MTPLSEIAVGKTYATIMNTGDFSRGVTIDRTLHVQNEEACPLYRFAIVKNRSYGSIFPCAFKMIETIFIGTL